MAKKKIKKHAKVHVVLCLHGDHQISLQVFKSRAKAKYEAEAIIDEETYCEDTDAVHLFESRIKQ